MSGSPKYSSAQLERQRQEQLERERQERAAREAQLRQEAEERERKRQLEVRRQQVLQQGVAFQNLLAQQHQAIYADQAEALQRQLAQQQQAIKMAQSESMLQTVARFLEQLERELQQAIAQKRRDDDEKKRQAELERQRFLLEELQQQMMQIPDAHKFDAVGQMEVQRALEVVKQAIATGDPAQVRQPLQRAEQIFTRHQQQVEQQRSEWQRRKAIAEEQLGELQALIAGLQQDPVVMCWQGQVVAQLQMRIQEAEGAIAREQFEAVVALLTTSRQHSETMIATANSAQLKADQRDYITDSIAQSLEALGFTVLYRQAEHPDQPASAIVLGAKSHAGKGVSVSVPLEGEVFYDVEGYAKNTVAAVGGGSAATCDEAEQVIDEMHTVLAEQFGVQMGELQWDGKDPNRLLRKADDLPRSEKTRMRDC